MLNPRSLVIGILGIIILLRFVMPAHLLNLNKQLQWNAKIQTSEIRKAPKSGEMLVRISDVWYSDIRAVRTTQTSLNKKSR